MCRKEKSGEGGNGEEMETEKQKGVRIRELCASVAVCCSVGAALKLATLDFSQHCLYSVSFHLFPVSGNGDVFLLMFEKTQKNGLFMVRSVISDFLSFLSH